MGETVRSIRARKNKGQKLKKYLFLFFLTTNLWAQEAEKIINEAELLDFSSIKDIIKKDGLENQMNSKDKKQKQTIAKKKEDDLKKYDVPTQQVFWSMFSELWLVKNATKLKWDFQKPDFDLENAFRDLMEKQGIYEKKFKILLVDSTELIHVALPSNDNEYIFLISYPFIKSLDLSKVEISLILFEDYLRAKRGYFKNFVQSKELDLYLGTNFKGKPFDKKIITTHLNKYSQKIFDKGFTFQEQFDVTMELNGLLKSDAQMWNTYYKLLDKIDAFIKDNPLYKKYGQIYPSPELQKNWIKPQQTRF